MISHNNMQSWAPPQKIAGTFLFKFHISDYRKSLDYNFLPLFPDYNKPKGEMRKYL